MLSRLFIAALWPPARKWLTSWLLFVTFIVLFCYFPIISITCNIIGQHIHRFQHIVVNFFFEFYIKICSDCFCHVFGLCKWLIVYGNYVWHMSVARKTVNCCFPGISRISVAWLHEISRRYKNSVWTSSTGWLDVQTTLCQKPRQTVQTQIRLLLQKQSD